MAEPVAWLVPLGYRYVAVCAQHRDPEGRNTPLLRENVAPYGVRCARCARVLVQAHTGWRELFPHERQW